LTLEPEFEREILVVGTLARPFLVVTDAKRDCIFGGKAPILVLFFVEQLKKSESGWPDPNTPARRRTGDLVSQFTSTTDHVRQTGVGSGARRRDISLACIFRCFHDYFAKSSKLLQACSVQFLQASIHA
jgi:hypothetical protein